MRQWERGKEIGYVLPLFQQISFCASVVRTRTNFRRTRMVFMRVARAESDAMRACTSMPTPITQRDEITNSKHPGNALTCLLVFPPLLYLSCGENRAKIFAHQPESDRAPQSRPSSITRVGPVKVLL